MLCAVERAYFALGDDFQARLAQKMGPERAEALRAGRPAPEALAAKRPPAVTRLAHALVMVRTSDSREAALSLPDHAAMPAFILEELVEPLR